MKEALKYNFDESEGGGVVMTEFKIGDVVVRKNGLDRMIVTGPAIGYEYKHAYPCVWVDSKGPKHEWFYESDTLKLYEHPKE
ncbi:MAG: hypothetical protein ABSG75_18375 [Syntrophales bacterium]